jgi:hypothetical protein
LAKSAQSAPAAGNAAMATEAQTAAKAMGNLIVLKSYRIGTASAERRFRAATVRESVNLFLSVLRLQIESSFPCGPVVDQLNRMDALSLAAVFEENQSRLRKHAVAFRKRGPLNF